jgi:hypothetical protein
MRVGLLMSVVCGIMSCTGSSERQLTQDDKALIISDVRQTLNDYYAAIKARGLTAEFEYLDSSADFFWVPPGSEIPLSYDSIYRVLRQNAQAYKSVVNEWDTLRIMPLTIDLAMYTGRLRSTMTDTSEVSSTIRLVETGLMVRRKDGWKLLSGQTSLAP